MWRVVKHRTTGKEKGQPYRKTVALPFDTFMKANQQKAL